MCALKLNPITGKFDVVETDHTKLTNIGTNTHAQIDTHVASTSNPHSVTKAQVGLANVTNNIQMVAETAGDKLAAIRIRIEDGTDADTIKVTGAENMYHSITFPAVDNIGKGTTVGNISLSGGGNEVALLAALFTDLPVGPLLGQVTLNETAVTGMVCIPAVTNNNLRFFIRDNNLANVDLTAVLSGSQRIDARAMYIGRIA